MHVCETQCTCPLRSIQCCPSRVARVIFLVTITCASARTTKSRVSSRPGLRSRVLRETIETITHNKPKNHKRKPPYTDKNGFHHPQTPRLHPSRSRPPPQPQKLPAQPPSIPRQRAAELQRRRAECRRRAEFQASGRQRWEAREAVFCVFGVDGHAFADA